MRHLYLILLSTILSFTLSYAQNSCEVVINASLQKLPVLLIKNDFNQLESTANTLKAACERNELALRLQITSQLLQKQNTESSINEYINSGYDNILIQRFDDAAKKKPSKLYKDNPGKYQYFPLNHSVDSLLKVKALALLRSEHYTLNNKESAIAFLFADDIDNFYQELNKKPTVRPSIDKMRERENMKSAPTIGINLGLFSPLGNNPIYENSPIFGISLMGPLSNNIIPELNYKFRIHNNSTPIDMRYKSEIREVDPKTSHFIGVGVGYKVYDNGRFIILPKINSGLGFIWTGLSESYYEEDEYGNEHENISFKNINTWHNSVGVLSMLHLRRKTYLGIELNYHIIPYNWDSTLISKIPNNYCSVEFSIRF